ncbi:MAG: orotidine 5'-phosphate decarboxylase [Nitrospirales bacterium]|nr:MAG: orotidine 5'-phosphate decarboxylase [Nitrospirales bacterium]
MGDQNFADVIIDRTRKLGHPLCVGLDPHVDRIPNVFFTNNGRKISPVEGMATFFHEVVERLNGKVVAVKPQSAFFEQYGAKGIRVLEELIVTCKQQGTPVILDAKRGDIGSTASAYAALIDASRAESANAITLNAYLGTETIEPFLPHVIHGGAGIFVLVKTSNPGAAEFQGLTVDHDFLYCHVAKGLLRLLPETIGTCGWSSIGIVVGGTYPADAMRIREILPHSIFLVPGYGAQGASVKDALAGFVKGPVCLEGGVVSASRSILYPVGVEATAGEWEAAFDEAVSRSAHELQEASSQD